MSYINYQKAIVLAEKCKGYLVGSGVSEETIKHAEQKLKIVFSVQLREYLKTYSYIEFDGNEFYGIIKDDFSAISEGSIVESAMYNREKFSLPLKWVPIYNYNDGNMAYLDYSDLNEVGEAKIIMAIYTGSEYTITEELSEDLGDFLLEMVQYQLENQF